MKIEKLGVQLHTIRDFMKDENGVRESFKKLKALGYDQGQTSRVTVPIAYDLYGEIAEKEGFEIVGTHDDFKLMCDNFEESLAKHKALKMTELNMGIGGWFDSYSPEKVEDFIAKANNVAEKVAANGGKFTYHNHQREFVKLPNGKIVLDMLFEGLNPKNTSFVLDTYWIQYGGGDVCQWIEKMAGRVDILHLKDMMIDDEYKPYFTEIGNGNLCWEKILETAEKAGVKYYVVEQDFCPGDPFDSLKKSSEYLHKNFM